MRWPAWVKETRSSSSTFLDHIHLSGPVSNRSSTPFVDDNVLQLVVDYGGGTKQIYRCNKIKLELNPGEPEASHVFKCACLGRGVGR
jgi:hypothetical protein